MAHLGEAAEKGQCASVPRRIIRRVAKAVEAGEVPAELVTQLHSELEAVRERSEEEARAAAIQHIADLAVVPEKVAAKTLAAVEARPGVTREVLVRRFVEASLVQQREEQQAGQKGGEDG